MPEPARCLECDRTPLSAGILRSTTTTLCVSHCASCRRPFSLDEIQALFLEANQSDSASARLFRRRIVDDLLAVLRRIEVQ